MQEAQPTMDALKPSYNPPHSHLPLAVVTAIICALLNFTSLALGIPAIVLSALVSLVMHKNHMTQKLLALQWNLN